MRPEVQILLYTFSVANDIGFKWDYIGFVYASLNTKSCVWQKCHFPVKLNIYTEPLNSIFQLSFRSTLSFRRRSIAATSGGLWEILEGEKGQFFD